MPFVLVLGALISLVSLAAFFGGRYWVLDLIANFRPHLAAGVAVAALALLLGRWRKSAVAVGLVAVVNLAVVVPVFVGPSDRPQSTDLRIMSFNLLSTNTNYEEVIDFINEERPDLVVLHEVSQPWEEALAAAGLDYEITRGRTEELIFGSLVMAPPGSSVQSFGFAVSSPRAIEVILPSGVAALSVHPLAPFPQAQTEQRQFQFEFAGLWALGQDGPRVIVGDFNAGPWSYPFRRLRAITGMLNSAAGFGLELSYPADTHPLLQVSIDHLLHSSNLAVVDRRLGPPMGSDHLPLVVDLSIVESS